MILDKEKTLADLKLLLQSSRSTQDITPQILELLTKNLKGSWAAYWGVDKKSQILRFIRVWNSPEMDQKSIDDNISKRTFGRDEGMPGRVWKTKIAASSSDLVRDMMLPRSLKALYSGLSFGMWIPVIDQDNIHGVIEILGARSVASENELETFLQTIGEEIGKVL